MSNKKRRSKNKSNTQKRLDPHAAQRAAIAAAKKELEDAKASMLEAQNAQKQIAQQVQQLQQQTKMAEQQKNEASKNLDGINSDLTDTLTSEHQGTEGDLSSTSSTSTSSNSSSPTLPSYGDKDYWNQRYSEDSNSSTAHLHVDEWYVDSLDQLEPFLNPFIYDKTEQRVLDLGCGTSTIGDQMSKAGYEHIHCVDYSEAVIDTCKRRQKIRGGGPVYATMDARSLTYPDGHFRCVVDKGTMDAMLSGGASGGAAAKEAVQSATEMLNEVHRVLEDDGGAYVLVSSMPPHVYIPTIKDMTDGFDIQHQQTNAEWSTDLSLQIYTLIKRKKLTAPSSGLPFTEEQMKIVREYAKAAQAEQKNNAGSTTKTAVPTPVVLPPATKHISLSVVRHDTKQVLLKWCVEGNDVADAVGGSERDYIVLCQQDVLTEHTHIYESMEWLEIDDNEDCDEEEEGEFGRTPTKGRGEEDVGKEHLEGMLRFATPKKDGAYEFRYVAESVAWNLTVDTVVHVSAPFLLGKTISNNIHKEQKEEKKKHTSTASTTSTTSTAPTAPTAPTAFMASPELVRGLMGVAKPQTMDKLTEAGPPLPPDMAAAATKNKLPTTQLTYLLEKRNNISCYQLFIHRPIHAVGDVPVGSKPPPVPSPPDVRLHIDAKYHPSLVCQRDSLSLTFFDEFGASMYHTTISFGECPIDPKKSTFSSLPGHWSFRLPFYFGGSETDVDREHPRHRLPKPGELTIQAMSTVRCGFCEEDMFQISGMRRVTRAPSPYWSELSDYWFCLKEQASPRLKELSAHGGDYPIAHNDVVNDRVSILSILESDGLDLQNRVIALPLEAKTTTNVKDGVVAAGPMLAPGCNGTTYEILHPGIVPEKNMYRTNTSTTSSVNSSTNPVVKKGSVVNVHARGTLSNTGATFWDTRSSNGGATFRYVAGMGAVIRGWDQGCLGMAVNERRRIVIPSHEAYGKDGFKSWGIPANASITFDLTCVSISDKAGESGSNTTMQEDLRNALLGMTMAASSDKEDQGGHNHGHAHDHHAHDHAHDHDHSHTHDHDHSHIHDHNTLPSSNPAILSCKRCLTTIGTSQRRDDGTNVVRMWKCHLNMSSTNAQDEEKKTETTFDRYTVDSIVGHAVLDGMEQRGMTRYVVQTFAVDDGGESAFTNEERVEMTMTVLNAHEFAASHEFPEMQPVIRVLYETETSQRMQIRRSPELWQRNASDWVKKHGAERIILSEEDAESMIENLSWTTSLLPESSRELNEMQVGFLRW